MKFKRFISAVLSLMMISSMITTAAAAEKTDKASTSDTSPIIGDLDYDGRITSADSLFVLRASVGLEKLTEEKQKLADVDIDGNISSADALEILRYSVGLPVTSEVGNSLYENSEISDFKADKNTIPVGVESTITFTVKIADKNLKPNLIYKCDLDNAGVINFVNFNDTGFYGDKKADDGIYTCEFNVTPREAVVYQFYVDCRTARSANITVRAVDSGNAGSDKDSTDIFSSTDVDSDSTDVHSDTDIVLSNFTSDEEYFSCDKDSSITFTAEASGKSDSVGLYKNDSFVGNMHDDGRNGDEKANDRVYTYVVKEKVKSSDSVVKHEYCAKVSNNVTDNVNIYFFPTVTEKNIDKIHNDFDSIRENMTKIEEKYLDDTGYVPTNKWKNVISDMTKALDKEIEKGTVLLYEVEDNSIYAKLVSGLALIYEPSIEGTDSVGSGTSMKIYTYQPNYTQMITRKSQTSLEEKKSWINKIDITAKDISDELDNYSYSSSTNFDDEEVTRTSICNIRGNRVVWWQGHGYYGPVVKSCLYLGEKFDWNLYIYNTDYAMDCIKDRIVNGFKTRHIIEVDGETFDNILISSKFIDEYCGRMDNSFIYLGTCYSGQTNKLANSFLNKGATAVVGNINSINTYYDISMAETTLKTMVKVNPNTDNYYTLEEAMHLAKKENGTTDSHGAEALIFGGEEAENYRLAETPWLKFNIKSESDSKSINNADVYIYNNDGELIGKLESDKNGEAKMRVKPDYYSIKIVCQGYKDYETDVTLSNSSITGDTYLNVFMKPYARYADVIKEYEEKYGELTMAQLDDYYYMDGVFLLELIDFNNDGQRELVIGYENNGSSKNVFDYNVDVWSCDEKGNTFKAYSGKGMKGDPFYNGGGNYLIRYGYKDGKYYLLQDKANSSSGTDLLEFDGSKFKTASLSADIDEYTDAYYGKAVYYCTEIMRYPRAMYNKTLEVKKSLGLNSELADIIDSGTTNDGLSWKLHKTGMLFISGSGSMKNYSSVSATPWYKYKSQITSVEFDPGVTSVSQYAFKGYKLHHIYFSDTITSIGKQAFADVNWVYTQNYRIFFDGDVPSIASDAFQNIESGMAWYYPYYGNYDIDNNPWLKKSKLISNIEVWDYADPRFNYAINDYYENYYHREEINEDYLNAYAEFLKSNQTTYKNSKFMLGFVNNDDIPELIICTDASRVGKVKYYTYYNNKVVLTAEIGSYGVSTYIPKGNIMAGSDMQTGISYGVYYKMKDDGTGEQLVSYSNNAETGGSDYYINGKSVSKSEYDNALKPYANNNYVKASYSDGFAVDSTNIKRLSGEPSKVVNPNDSILKNYYNK